MKCNHCGDEIKTPCDWRQGRCPHSPAMIDCIINDQYKARFYNLIRSFTNLFKKDK